MPDASTHETQRPISPPVSRERALHLAESALGTAGGTVVYVDLVTRGPGTFVIGREAMWVDRAVIIAFRDEFPGATWPRPCTYALIDPESGEVRATASSDRPPQFGRLPESWIVASDPAGHADLIPPGTTRD